MAHGDFHPAGDDTWQCEKCERKGSKNDFGGPEVDGMLRCECGGVAYQIVGHFEL